MRHSVWCTVVLLTACAAQADTLRLSSSPFSFGHGGEFRAEPLTGNAGVVGLPADTTATSLQTFCMEAGENFHPGDVFNFVLNTGAVNGGVPGGFDPLDARTAYLYTYFRLGILPGYNYMANRSESAGDLQKAIWFIEDESGGVNNAFVAQANAAVALGGVWFGQGIGNVRVLNLTRANGERAQDQLTIITPIPTPGGRALVLLGGALVRGRRR